MTTSIDPHAPAHPVASAPMYPGLTKREWFAGIILAGIMANPTGPGPTDPAKSAEQAVRQADALIADLNVSGK